MRGYEAYKQAQNLPPLRIDVILELYRVAMDSLERARLAFAEQGQDGARSLLTKSQTAIMGLAAALPAYNNDLAATFLRLYEYVSRQMVQPTAEGLASAAQVLRTLQEGFLQVRDQAVSLEVQHKILPLSHEHLICVNA